MDLDSNYGGELNVQIYDINPCIEMIKLNTWDTVEELLTSFRYEIFKELNLFQCIIMF